MRVAQVNGSCCDPLRGVRAWRSSKAEGKGMMEDLLLDPKGIVRFEGMPHYLTDGNLETLMTRYGL